MALVDSRTELEVIDHAECVRLLAERQLGRVGIAINGRPVILPINYVMDDEHVIFRTDPGTKLTAAVRNAPVAFEIDGMDNWYRGGWSVLVRGFAEEVTDGTELDRLSRLPLRPWARGEKHHFIRIVPESITGRRIAVAAAT